MFKPSRRAAPCSRAVLTLGDAAMGMDAVCANGPDLALAARNACVKSAWSVRDASPPHGWPIPSARRARSHNGQRQCPPASYPVRHRLAV